MDTAVQLRRGNTTALASFYGLEGGVVVDTDTNSIVNIASATKQAHMRPSFDTMATAESWLSIIGDKLLVQEQSVNVFGQDNVADGKGGLFFVDSRNIGLSGSLRTNYYYEIKVAGTGVFTSSGAADNSVGTKFYFNGTPITGSDWMVDEVEDSINFFSSTNSLSYQLVRVETQKGTSLSSHIIGRDGPLEPTPTPNAAADDLLIENNSTAGMTILSNSMSASTIAFGDENDSYVGGITYTHSGDEMRFKIGGSQKLVLKSSNLSPLTSNDLSLGTPSFPWGTASISALESDIAILSGSTLIVNSGAEIIISAGGILDASSGMFRSTGITDNATSSTITINNQNDVLIGTSKFALTNSGTLQFLSFTEALSINSAYSSGTNTESVNKFVEVNIGGTTSYIRGYDSTSISSSSSSGWDLNVGSGEDLNVNSGGEIIIQSGGDLTVNSGGDLTVNPGGEILIKSTGELDVESGGFIIIRSGGNLFASEGTLTLADDQISGNKLHGGVYSNFRSTGIDDNSTSTTITINNENDVRIGASRFAFTNSGTMQFLTFTEALSINGAFPSGTNTESVNKFVEVNIGGTTSYIRGYDSTSIGLDDDQISGDKLHGGVYSNFRSTGITDNATSTTITINSDNDVRIGASRFAFTNSGTMQFLTFTEALSINGAFSSGTNTESVNKFVEVNIGGTTSYIRGYDSTSIGLADDQISGDKLHGGVYSNFRSTGITDNATSTTITINNENDVRIGASRFAFTNSGTMQFLTFTEALSINGAFSSGTNTESVNKFVEVNIGGTTSYIRGYDSTSISPSGWDLIVGSGEDVNVNSGGSIIINSGGTLDVSAGSLALANDQISGDKLHGGVYSNFSSTGIDDNATSTTITINDQNDVLIGDLTINSGGTLDVSAGSLALADDQISGDKLHGGVYSNFRSTGITDSATSTIITINSDNDVLIGTSKFSLTNSGTLQFLSFTEVLSINGATSSETNTESVNKFVEVNIGGTTSYIRGYSSTSISSSSSGWDLNVDSGEDLNVNSGGEIIIKSGGRINVAPEGIHSAILNIKSGGGILISSGGGFTVNSGGFINLSAGSLTLANNQISGDKLHGGVYSNFRSTGITDNATSTIITINNENDVLIGTSKFSLTNSGTLQFLSFTEVLSINGASSSETNTESVNKFVEVNIGGTTSYIRGYDSTSISSSGWDLIVGSGEDLNVNSGGEIIIKSGGDLTVNSGGTLDVSAGTLALVNNQISGNKLHGGTYSNFRSTGIDDNATSTTITINNQNDVLIGDLTINSGGTLDVNAGTLTLADDQISGDKLHGGVYSNFRSTGITDSATSTIITINSDNDVLIGTSKFSLTNSGTMQFLSFTEALSINDATSSGTNTESVNKFVEVNIGGTTSYIRGYSSTSISPSGWDLIVGSGEDLNVNSGGEIIIKSGGDLTVNSGGTLDVSAGTLALVNNQISGNKLHGGTYSNFRSTGIDDNATSTTITINNENDVLIGDLTINSGGTLDVSAGTLALADDQISGDKLHGGVYSNFRSTGITDNATSTIITINSDNDVLIGTSKFSLTNSGTMQFLSFTEALSINSAYSSETNTESVNKFVEVNIGGTTSYIRGYSSTSISSSSSSGWDLIVGSGEDLNVNSGGDLNVNSGGEIIIKSGGDLTVNSGGTLDIRDGSLRLEDGQISGNKIEGGVILDFRSGNITDHWPSNDVTIDDVLTIGDHLVFDGFDAHLEFADAETSTLGSTSDARRGWIKVFMGNSLSTGYIRIYSSQ